MFGLTHIKLPFIIDDQIIESIKSEIYQFPVDTWITHYRSEEYIGDWAVLPLRSVHGHPLVIHATPGANIKDYYKNTPYLNSSQNLLNIINRFKCPIGSARLMRLGVNAEILEHTDDMGHGNMQEIRIHIPIITNDDVKFWLDNKIIQLREGEVWYADFNFPHKVINKGNTDRIHLVLDCVPDEWLNLQLLKGAQITKIVSFLTKIGIKTHIKKLQHKTFLPGIEILRGELFIDMEQLEFPGDILHEAGHIAIVEKAKRHLISADTGANDENAIGSEIATILWSFAALTEIGLDPNVVFHPNGYKGQSDWFIHEFTAKNYIGLRLLEWMGMCVSNPLPQNDDTPGFPSMKKWLRD